MEAVDEDKPAMEAVDEYKPANEFQKDIKDPLLNIPLSDSKELWLIQWPDKQDPDFDGQEVSIKLHHDGQLASFESSSGISYEMVSYASQEPDATVFLSSTAEAKIVGKISRRVSLVRYPELSELENKAKEKAKEAKEKAKAERLAQKNPRTRGTLSTATTLTPSKSSGGKRGTFPAFSGMPRGKLSDSDEPSSKRSKKRHDNEPTKTISKAVNFSDEPGSGVTTTSLGSAGSSRSENSKKKKKIDEEIE